jgi:enamine deaminase RidA (YjgF/YER057c/UK114 family)
VSSPSKGELSIGAFSSLRQRGKRCRLVVLSFHSWTSADPVSFPTYEAQAHQLRLDLRARDRYSRAVAQGDWVFVSGTTGFDYSTMTLADGIQAQTEQCLKNIESALQQAGSSLKDVVRVTYVLPDAKEFPQCWPILRKYFGEVRPAAMMISANLLDPRMRIEIEVTALKQPR